MIIPEKFEFWYSFWRPWNGFKTEVRHFWESVCRFFYWGWKMRMNYDWDSNGIYEMIMLKLDRMIPIFENTEYHHYSVAFLRRMKVVRELARRLREEGYNQHYDAYIAKWGRAELDFKTTPDGKGNRRCIFIDPPTVNDENRAQYEKEHKEAVEADYKDQQKDKKLLFDMLNHYMEKWVD